MLKPNRALLFLSCCLTAFLFAAVTTLAAPPAPVIKVSALRSHPHNSSHFTQGLFFHNGKLYESVGRYGESLLAVKDPQSGKSLKEARLGQAFFGEGSTVAAGHIYMLTWREQTAFIFNPDTLVVEGWFNYPGEGWGLTYDGRRLIRSDGSDTLYFHGLNGEGLGSLKVRDGNEPVRYLNELEWIPAQNLILANIWTTPLIVAIDPESGKVRFKLDISALVPPELRGSAEAVPNGIALAPDGKTLWLTGKLWPVIYEAAWPPGGAGTLRE